MKTVDQNAINRELEIKNLQLHWLLQITKAINYNLHSDGLFAIYKSVMQEQLHVGRMILLVYQEEWKVAVQYNCSVPDGISELAAMLIQVTEAPSGAMELPEGFETVIPVVHQGTPLAFALIGGIDDKIMGSRREVVTYIHTITNVIVVAIENKRLEKDSVHRAVLQRELDMAAQIQSMLFPDNLVTNQALEIAATYIPHSAVGGDYYDFIPLNETEAIVCMADVSGKGMSAAMLMSNFQANLRALVNHTDHLPDIVRELNDRVFKTARGDRFITFFIAKVNTESHQLEYINAGHHPPLIIDDRKVLALEKGTTGLGMFDALPFLELGTAAFGKQALLFCYTDGVTELENNEGIAFGFDALTELLLQHPGDIAVQELHDMLVKSLHAFRSDAEMIDDVTFLSLRLRKNQ